MNEALNWKCNYELGILDPFIEDPEHVLGGKNSRANIFHPYQNEHELKLALNYMTAEITEASWALWIGIQLDIERMLYEPEAPTNVSAAAGSSPEKNDPPRSNKFDFRHQKTAKVETVDLTMSGDRASRPVPGLLGLPTPASSSEPLPESGRTVPSPAHFTCHRNNPLISNSTVVGPTREPSNHTSTSKRITSYKTLQDFYSLLDRIERTSYVGALFLEAYAEKLRDDTCQKCWFNHNVKLDFF